MATTRDLEILHKVVYMYFEENAGQKKKLQTGNKRWNDSSGLNKWFEYLGVMLITMVTAVCMLYRAWYNSINFAFLAE